jgi:hypothetical protein
MFPACAVVEAACEIYHPGYPKKNRGFQPRDLSCVLKFFWEGICFFPGIIYYNQTNVIFVRTVVPSSRGLQESYNKASLIIVAFML